MKVITRPANFTARKVAAVLTAALSGWIGETTQTGESTVTDETLMAQLKEIGNHFLKLQEQGKERGLETRYARDLKTGELCIEVWKKA